jgi:hypothetical protein
MLFTDRTGAFKKNLDSQPTLQKENPSSAAFGTKPMSPSGDKNVI